MSKPYTIIKTVEQYGAYKGQTLWVVKFHTGPMAGGSGSDVTKRDLMAWIKSLGY